jgi:hypothetical protein
VKSKLKHVLFTVRRLEGSCCMLGSVYVWRRRLSFAGRTGCLRCSSPTPIWNGWWHCLPTPLPPQVIIMSACLSTRLSVHLSTRRCVCCQHRIFGIYWGLRVHGFLISLSECLKRHRSIFEHFDKLAAPRSPTPNASLVTEPALVAVGGEVGCKDTVETIAIGHVRQQLLRLF